MVLLDLWPRVREEIAVCFNDFLIYPLFFYLLTEIKAAECKNYIVNNIFGLRLEN